MFVCVHAGGKGGALPACSAVPQALRLCWVAQHGTRGTHLLRGIVRMSAPAAQQRQVRVAQGGWGSDQAATKGMDLASSWTERGRSGHTTTPSSPSFSPSFTPTLATQQRATGSALVSQHAQNACSSVVPKARLSTTPCQIDAVWIDDSSRSAVPPWLLSALEQPVRTAPQPPMPPARNTHSSKTPARTRGATRNMMGSGQVWHLFLQVLV